MIINNQLINQFMMYRNTCKLIYETWYIRQQSNKQGEQNINFESGPVQKQHSLFFS